MIFYRIMQHIAVGFFLLFPCSAFAHILSITPAVPFPSTLSTFSGPFTASYQVKNVSQNINFTVIDKSEFPSGSGLSLTASNCGNLLTPGQYCTIQVSLNPTTPTTISTYLREWAKPTADGVQYPINVQVTSIDSGLLFASAVNGNVYVSANNGAGWSATKAAPNNGTAVNCVKATSSYLYACSGSNIYYSNNGMSWAATNAPDGSLINNLFINSAAILYVGTTNGNVYFSTDNGVSWQATSQPDGSAVNSIFVTSTGNLYAGTANGNVYYSSDNGASWLSINGQPDGSAIRSVYVVGGTLYIGTADEYVYTSTALTGGGAWTFYAETAYSLFINSSGSIIDAGTQNGYVYSLLTGTKLGFVANSPITGVFQL